MTIPFAAGQGMCTNSCVDNYEVGDICSDCCCDIQVKNNEDGFSYENSVTTATQWSKSFYSDKDNCECVHILLDNNQPHYSPKTIYQDLCFLNLPVNLTIEVYQPKDNITDWTFSTSLPEDTNGPKTTILII